MAKDLGNILSTITLAVLFILCLAFAAIRLLGLGSFIVTGGSMEPNIHRGALVLVQPVAPSEVVVGDVITFQQYDQTTTHRVTGISKDEQGLVFKTKGDANAAADPEDKTFPGRVGVVRASLPVAGYLTASMQAYWRLLLTVVAAITFFSCAGALVFRREPSPAARPKPVRRVVFAPVLVTVDADETWQAHLAWLRSARAAAQRPRWIS